ncbi:TPA: hypothetical protein SMQ11_003805 [Proteus mirabilis]|nr:hypothetical protein [Morganella morganii]HEK1015510.1 hypothetical protein [Proteus mirabilis]HEK1946709.1 hypothetical protein [Proteus mirabilis]
MEKEIIPCNSSLNIIQFSNPLGLSGVTYYRGIDTLANLTTYITELKQNKVISNLDTNTMTTDGKLLKAWYSESILIHAVIDFQEKSVILDLLHIHQPSDYECIEMSDLVYLIRTHRKYK